MVLSLIEHSLCAFFGMDHVHVDHVHVDHVHVDHVHVDHVHVDHVHVDQKEECTFVEAVVRVLVALEPYMYAQVLAFHLCQQCPRSEVVLASLNTLSAEAGRTRPHLIIANNVPPEYKERVFWAEVRTDDDLEATIKVDGHLTTIHDVSLEDLVALVVKTEEELARE